MKLQALAAAAAILAAGSTGLASAQTASPVTIDGHVVPAVYGTSRNILGTAAFTFVNQSNVPAKEVDIALTSHGRTLDTYRDVGTFAPGVAVHAAFGSNFPFLDQQVEIASVTFADGSTWTNSDVPQPRLQAGASNDDAR